MLVDHGARSAMLKTNSMRQHIVTGTPEPKGLGVQPPSICLEAYDVMQWIAYLIYDKVYLGTRHGVSMQFEGVLVLILRDYVPTPNCYAQ